MMERRIQTCEFPDPDVLEQEIRRLIPEPPGEQLDERVRQALAVCEIPEVTMTKAARVKFTPWGLLVCVGCLILGVGIGRFSGTNPHSANPGEFSVAAGQIDDFSPATENLRRPDSSVWTHTALWERQSGQFFNVKTHVADLRFDNCRLCHMAGG